MARTYSFDHFTVPSHAAEPAQPGDEKARVAGKPGARGDGRPRYGKRFAETEELSYVRQMNHQLEELAGVESPKISTPREPERLHAVRPYVLPAGYQGPPIGAVPAATAPAAPAPETFRDLLGTGARQIRLLRHCVADGVAASYRLAALPLKAVKLTVRSIKSALDPLQLLRPPPHPA
ncbi:MAG TPA: hypothetical protein VFB81_24180 [Myxococcales bacterium]|nr:hypothetical protein [Myxococcales bacterium]